MTKAEELDWIYRLRSNIYVYMPKEWLIPMNNALGAAIKALEKEPCEDTISRQAAIDAIDRLDIPEDMCVYEILSHIELEIGNLPSAQPERKKGNEKCSNKLPCGWCSLFDTPCFGRGGEQDG